MQRLRVLVVHRRSNYAEILEEESGGAITDLVQKDDPLVKPLVEAHDAHAESMAIIRRELERLPVDATWVHDLSGVVPDEFDLVVAVGGDGTVLHASHAIGSTPVLGLNSSPSTSVGYLTAGAASQAGRLVERALAGELPVQRLYRMEVRVGDRVVTSRALNDVLVCHECPATTSRYKIRSGDRFEHQMSSGVWVATATGSTAAIGAAGGRAMRAGSRRLQFVVREPFPCGGVDRLRAPRMVSGFVPPGQILEIRSRSTGARLYVDGPHVVFPLGFGDLVSFCGAAAPLNLLGYRHQKSS
ncbi:MAG TPA: NAD(+)/NADH kinase [Polyangia bacterium]|nr:NAD(+)/NADH kinase [Polyangia bacterium]